MTNSVAVLGSGIIGTTLAWQLQTQGARTTLIGELGRGASFASFASLSAFDEPLTEVYAIKSLGMGYWRRWNREFDNRLGLRWDGEIRWAETAESAHTLSSKISRASRRGYSVRHISSEELAELLPHSRPAQVAEACQIPEDGQADPVQAMKVLRETFMDEGGRIIDGRATVRFNDSGPVVLVGDDRIEVDAVAVASGTETAALMQTLGTELPMDPSPGLLVITEPTEPVLQGTVYVSPVTWPAIHLRQLDDGRVIIGERSQEYVANKPTMRHARELLRQAQRSFPVLGKAQIEHYTVQWRPMPRDGMPIVGTVPGLSSVYVATGHSGVTVAPAIATLAAAEIVTGTQDSKLASFRPSRFADQTTYLAQEIEAAFKNPA